MHGGACNESQEAAFGLAPFETRLIENGSPNPANDRPILCDLGSIWE